VETLRSLAAEKSVSATQLAIAWVLAKGESIVPVMGARTPAQLAESLAALPINLSPAEMTRIEEAIPASAIAGDRYAAPHMQMLDSEP
jgi:aryl-alcohol dehydrogenase-like predicted oxidoreductase